MTRAAFAAEAVKVTLPLEPVAVSVIVSPTKGRGGRRGERSVGRDLNEFGIEAHEHRIGGRGGRERRCGFGTTAWRRRPAMRRFGLR